MVRGWGHELATGLLAKVKEWNAERCYCAKIEDPGAEAPVFSSKAAFWRFCDASRKTKWFECDGCGCVDRVGVPRNVKTMEDEE